MDQGAKIIVVGNEKGGAGKTTTAMNLITSLLYLNFKVTSIDTDVRQLSLSRYVDNRVSTINKLGLSIPMQTHHKISQNINQQEERAELERILEIARRENDFIVIDTPGTNNPISEFAHSQADLVITPINDSFVDIDLLAHVNPDNLKIIKPGIYSQMVWEQKMNRVQNNKKPMDWVVVRNRVNPVDTINRRNIEKVIAELSKRVGCRLAAGFGERVIFKELFLQGITLLDLKDKQLKPMSNLSLSHVIARQELINLLEALNIPAVTAQIKMKMF